MRTLFLFLCLHWAAGGFLMGAGEPGETRVGEMSLRIRDIAGEERAPFELNSDRAIVLIFVVSDCPIANGYSGEIGRLLKEYGLRGVRGSVVYADPDLTLEAVRAHAKEYGHEGYPCFLDREHLMVKAAGATRTPEAVVVGREGAILYRGRIDNRYASLGRARREATVRDLRVALDEILAGVKVSTPRTVAVGCHIPSLKRPAGVRGRE